VSEIRSYRESHSDPESASLFVFEYSKLPWQPLRMYLLQDFVDGTTRGNHAHKTLSQIIVMVSGTIDLVIYRGEESFTYNLSRESGEILLSPGTWRVFSNASPDAVVLVLADSPYDESDYLRNWEDYLFWFNQNNE
jgi:hypothetical protein